MLIPLQSIIDKYHPAFTGVIHAGAHWGEEYHDYKRAGCQKIIFIEPCKAALQKLAERFVGPGTDPDVLVLGFAASNVKGKMMMHIETTNHGASNSLLAPKVHLEQHPNIIFDEQEEVYVDLLDNVLKVNKDKLNPKDYNFLAMDCQGGEGNVLRGAVNTLKHIDYVYTEVNRAEMYAGNTLIGEMDSLLKDFTRVETVWASPSHGWGDAFYIRTSKM